MTTDCLEVSCPCGNRAALDGDEFSASDWAFFGETDVIEGDDHFAYCPACESVRRAMFEHEADDGRSINASLGRVVVPPEFTDDGEAETLSERLGCVTPDGTPALGLCPTCEEPIVASDRREGPDHPEIGWTYYVCSDCDDALSPACVSSVIS